MLRVELAFYLGCLNLHRWLERKRQPTCFPEPLPHGRPMLAAHGLYDVCLTLHLEQQVVGNEVNADRQVAGDGHRRQPGWQVDAAAQPRPRPADDAERHVRRRESFRASVCIGVFTHYKREEDDTMESGKLDEELRRMSEIADRIAPGALLLCNESFASTNEREGSEIARQVVRAMLDRRIRVVFVTHMYDLAHSFYAQRLDNAVFLRADRGARRPAHVQAARGRPLPTSYGEDSYRRIFGNGQVSAQRRHGAETLPSPPLENSPKSR